MGWDGVHKCGLVWIGVVWCGLVVRGDWSANRPISGAADGVQFEANSWEEEVEVLCVGAVKSGPSSALNMACELCDDWSKMARTEILQSKHSSLVKP